MTRKPTTDDAFEEAEEEISLREAGLRMDRIKETTQRDLKREYKLDFDMIPLSKGPMYIPYRDIPEDMMYFWAAQSCLGEQRDSRIMELSQNGYSFVPPSRHPYLQPPKEMRKGDAAEYIFWGGLVLMEISKELYKRIVDYVQKEVDLVEGGISDSVGGKTPVQWRQAVVHRMRTGMGGFSSW